MHVVVVVVELNLGMKIHRTVQCFTQNPFELTLGFRMCVSGLVCEHVRERENG
jgi:hypothetical protein